MFIYDQSVKVQSNSILFFWLVDRWQLITSSENCYIQLVSLAFFLSFSKTMFFRWWVSVLFWICMSQCNDQTYTVLLLKISLKKNLPFRKLVDGVKLASYWPVCDIIIGKLSKEIYCMCPTFFILPELIFTLLLGFLLTLKALLLKPEKN